jgi:hypothetical protein
LDKEGGGTMLKFIWNGIKLDGKLYRAHYSLGGVIGQPAETITIYAKDYIRFPAIAGFTVQNDSDIMTDYHETDRIRVGPDNPHYEAVKAALNAANKHYSR